MGQHADDCVNMCIDHEAEWDSYFYGHMSDSAAYEAGILDSQGCADPVQMDRVIGRNCIGTFDEINAELKSSIKDLALSTDTPARTQRQKQKVLNDAAIENLNKPNPTCNWCGEQMRPRNGKFGKFYFCDCPEQCTVSDKYWQSVRVKQVKPKITLAEWQRRVADQ